jgi:L-rhamnose mutarotase
MTRETWLAKILPGEKAELLKRYENAWPELKAAWAAKGYKNLSVWTVGDFAFGYREVEDDAKPTADEIAVCERWDEYMKDVMEVIAPVGAMRMMYHDIGIVREDKSLIRHRVFATILKPGCAEEYFKRHEALILARTGEVRQGPESNFTIWCADEKYIFGYCELVKSFDHEMTEAERASTIQWETRQLEIMDWLTDDVDWMTGAKHEQIRRVYPAQG